MGAAIAAAAIAAGATAYSASQTPDAPDPINYGAQYKKILRAQLQNAGPLFSAHNTWDPRYQQLDERLLIQRLLGGPGGEREEQYIEYEDVPGHYESSGQRDPNMPNGPIPRVWVPATVRPITRTRTVTDDPTRGLLDIYQKDLQPALRESEAEDIRTRIANEIQTMQQYGGDLSEAQFASNPGAARLIKGLTQQAGDELDLGGSLSKEQSDLVAQAQRSGDADRGMVYSPSSVFAEALKKLDAGEALKASRRSFAGNVAQLNQGFQGDTYQKFFGRSSGSTPNAGSFLNAPGGRTAPFNPESGFAQDIIGTNFNAAQSAYQAGQNNLNSTIGAGVGGIGQLLASYLRQSSNPGININPGNPTLYTPRQSGLQMSGSIGYGGV